MKKGFLSLVLCVVMLTSCAIGAIPAAASDGVPTDEARSIYDQATGLGTWSNPYIVYTWDDFDYYMKLPGTAVVRLDRDIEWIGRNSSDSYYFYHPIDVTGTVILDLNGHSVVKFNKYESVGGGNGSGKLLNVKGRLTINDSVGTGSMTVKGILKEGYVLEHVFYDGREDLITVEDGGVLQVNGGTFIPGYTVELYCAAAYVAKGEGLHGSYLDSDYNGYAWRVDSGTAITAYEGSTVIIRGGTFTGIGFADLYTNEYYVDISEKQAALEIFDGATVRIYNGHFHGDGGANMINYHGGDVEVYGAIFTEKSPRIIIGDRPNPALTYFRVEYDTSKIPARSTFPRAALPRRRRPEALSRSTAPPSHTIPPEYTKRFTSAPRIRFTIRTSAWDSSIRRKAPPVWSSGSPERPARSIRPARTSIFPRARGCSRENP
ncbi:MAG: hypothetical protein IJQ80_07305 [Clostridia bacterium]|nr:hypothetical protein [Clostridia bacterium]